MPSLSSRTAVAVLEIVVYANAAATIAATRIKGMTSGGQSSFWPSFNPYWSMKGDSSLVEIGYQYQIMRALDRERAP